MIVLQKGRIILCLLIVFLWQVSSAQEGEINWLPKEHVFPLLRNDVYETQPHFAANYISAPDSSYSGAYFPVNLAFRKSLLQWAAGEWVSQIGFAAGVYTQFELAKNENNEWLAGMLNSDFRAIFLYQLKKQSHSLRLRIFHQSSHLADDYMLRNDFFQVNNSKGNYEQLDLTYSKSTQVLQPYFGVGFIFSPNAYRKRWSMQLGIQSIAKEESVQLG